MNASTLHLRQAREHSCSQLVTLPHELDEARHELVTLQPQNPEPLAHA